ncbi:MAG: sigma factor-like helix-turn-helix DNA-binding protein [Patescibacteria group bacterium]|nr:sigma factor-like helix-turn-helix DNA-binding protein [Patescibacteria group bacterium]
MAKEKTAKTKGKNKDSMSLSFNPKKVVTGLMEGLAPRSRQIIKKRFGLDSKDTMTLEAVGQGYGITRERVRQIEDFTIKTIKKSDTFEVAIAELDELEAAMEDYGGIVHEQEFLASLSGDQVTRNNIHFLLVLGDAFIKLREDDYFHKRWTTDMSTADAVHQSLKNLGRKLSINDLLIEEDILEQLAKNLHDSLSETETRLHGLRWLHLSKGVGVSPVGEWGLANSPSVKVRGIRDYAFLIMRQHGSPMHFTEVAQAISDQFGRRANPATSHNELIKDDRFVLVGRGIYALADWGYTKGVVRDVVREILRRHGPLSKEDIIAKVLKERYVKPNTIMVNLKNPRHFSESPEGLFSIA